MLNSDEITYATTNLLEDGKLPLQTVDDLIQAFRLVIGPLEAVYNYEFETVLTALDDTGNTRKRAAKMAACNLRLINEDFGVSVITDGLTNSDRDQRELFTLFAFSLLYPIPIELMSATVFQQIQNSEQIYSAVVYHTIEP
jgi:hypothetical protein